MCMSIAKNQMYQPSFMKLRSKYRNYKSLGEGKGTG